jgi:hypothetical protein
MDDHTVAIKAPGQKLIRGTPQIKPETTVVELTEALYHQVSIAVKNFVPIEET